MNAHALQVTTPSDREIVINRVFNAPRELVWEAMSNPELVRRWLLGPPGWTMPVCEIDLRVGGKYRWQWRHQDGREMTMSGTHLEVVPPRRVVRTAVFDQDWTNGETVETAELTEHDGKTTLTTTVVYSSRQARDGALASGMTEGMECGYRSLDELLASHGL